MDVTVAVCVYGDPQWELLARERAILSAEDQAQTILSRGSSLAHARNRALSALRSEWVIFLDADDELEPGYVEAMSQGTADLRAPSLRFVTDGSPGIAFMPRVLGHETSCQTCRAECLRDGNFAVIGTAARASVLQAAGRFGAEPWAEDWALWARCVRDGASIECIPSATYRAHVNPESRNRRPPPEEQERLTRQIAEAVWG